MVASPPSTDGPNRKFERGCEHFGSFNKALERFLEHDPYEFVGQFDFDQPAYVVTTDIHTDPPIDLSVLLGDCVHNLRSALDHLAWQIARLKRDPPPQYTTFPIYADPTLWRAKRSGDLRPFRSSERTLINELQPCVRWNGSVTDAEDDPLWLLQW